jgi:hypothetical protein
MILAEHGFTDASLQFENGISRRRRFGSRRSGCRTRNAHISHRFTVLEKPAGIGAGRRQWSGYFEIDFINPSTIWSMLKLAGRWLGG